MSAMIKPVKTITPSAWATSETARAVFAALGSAETGVGDALQSPAALFVGGCVRNHLLGEAVTDFDIATIHSPDEVMARLKNAGIKAIPTGLSHGTVTAVKGGVTFEITTLRRDVAADGRHAEVAFTDDWAEDARRRDFTMNTLLLDPNGDLYDPTGQGLSDLEAGRVRFVGAADARVQEDYLRILRFFRFYARYGQGAPDEAALSACRTYANCLGRLSRERIADEIGKLLPVDKLVETMLVMRDNNILPSLFHHDFQPDFLARLVRLQQEAGQPEKWARLYLISGVEPDLLLPNAVLKTLSQYEEGVRRLVDLSEKSLKLLLYRYDVDVSKQIVLLFCAQKARMEDAARFLQILDEVEVPVFPLSGQDVMDAGVEKGPRVGGVLSEIEAWWISRDFPPREECLKKLEDLI